MSLGMERYHTSLQEGLNLYSSSFASLKDMSEKIDIRKGKWGRKERNPNFVEKLKDESERARLCSKHLGYYHEFVQTAKFSAEIVETLQTIHTKCNDPAISVETYEKINLLGEDAEAIRKKEEALVTVNQLIQSLAEKVDSMFKSFFEQRVYEIRSPLNSLLITINPLSAYTEIPGVTNRTVANAYPKWQETAESQQQNWKPEVEMDIVSSASFDKVAEDFAKLHRALQTLNLTYVDPETKLGYGVIPSGASSKSEENFLIGESSSEDAEETKNPPHKAELKPSKSNIAVTPLVLPEAEHSDEKAELQDASSSEIQNVEASKTITSTQAPQSDISVEKTPVESQIPKESKSEVKIEEKVGSPNLSKQKINNPPAPLTVKKNIKPKENK